MAQCAVCGSDVRDAVRASLPTQAAEPPDFDTRPGEPVRSTMHLWVDACPQCGYCADDLTRAAEHAPGIVESHGYRAILEDPTLPEKAKQFLCYACVLEKSHRFADAGWSALHASWVCDDANASGEADACRARAIDLWKRGKQVGQLFADDMATEFALVTDLYRRMGQFEHAAVACAEGLDLEDIPPALEAMLRRQSVLIQQRDTAPHSMKELMHIPAA